VPADQHTKGPFITRLGGDDENGVWSRICSRGRSPSLPG